jgi:two-component system sensor histidine kinase TctE
MVRAERAVTSLRHFTSNASHQMRTPLAVLRVHLDVLQAYGAQSPQGAMALDDIAASVTNLERLLNQLLSLARLDEQAEPPMGSFDPAQVAADVIASRLPAIESAGVSITFAQGPAEPPLAEGQASLAAEMIANLLDNAVAYNRPGGTVACVCRAWTAAPGWRSRMTVPASPRLSANASGNAFTASMPRRIMTAAGLAFPSCGRCPNGWARG